MSWFVHAATAALGLLVLGLRICAADPAALPAAALRAQESQASSQASFAITKADPVTSDGLVKAKTPDGVVASRWRELTARIERDRLVLAECLFETYSC